MSSIVNQVTEGERAFATLNSKLREMNSTWSQYRALVAIDSGCTSGGQVSRKTEVDAAAISRLIKKLIGLGQVERSEDGKLSVTPMGQQILESCSYAIEQLDKLHG